MTPVKDYSFLPTEDYQTWLQHHVGSKVLALYSKRLIVVIHTGSKVVPDINGTARLKATMTNWRIFLLYCIPSLQDLNDVGPDCMLRTRWPGRWLLNVCCFSRTWNPNFLNSSVKCYNHVIKCVSKVNQTKRKSFHLVLPCHAAVKGWVKPHGPSRLSA